VAVVVTLRPDWRPPLELRRLWPRVELRTWSDAEHRRWAPAAVLRRHAFALERRHHVGRAVGRAWRPVMERRLHAAPPAPARLWRAAPERRTHAPHAEQRTKTDTQAPRRHVPH
jgi:hypothetical protein